MSQSIALTRIAPPSVPSESATPAPSIAERDAFTALQDEQGVATAAVGAGLGVVHDEIEINIRLTRAPVEAGLVGNTTHGALATTGVTLGGADAGLNVTRTAALLAVPMNGPGSLVGHIGSASGLLYGSVGQTIGNTTLTGYHGFIGSTHATGLTTTTTLANVNLSSGIAFVGSGDASLKVDDYHAGQMQLVYADHFAGSLQFTGGVSLGYVGFGMRLGLNASRAFEFKTWMPSDNVARLLKGVSRTQERLSMLRLRRNLVPLPNLADPLNKAPLSGGRARFKVGDEMRLTYSGSLIGGIAITGAGIYAGVHISLAGTHTLNVQKLSETKVCIDITPKQVSRASTLAADFPLAFEAYAALAQSKATRYSYIFDLTKEEAMLAYQKALKGELPGPVANCDSWHALSEDEARRVVAEAVMPEGVEYAVLEQAAVPYERTRGVAMTLPKHLPFANLAGFGAEQRWIHEESVIADADVAIHNDSISNIYETQALHRGTTEITSFGTLKSARRSTDQLTTLEGVTVGITLSNDRTRRDSRNQMVKKLNNVLFKKAPLEWFEGPMKVSKYNYEVTLKRHVPVDALATLAPEGRSVREQAKLLREEVASKGLSGFAAVLDKIGADLNDIDVTVQSRAPKVIYEKVLQLSARYNTAIDPNTQKWGEINKRIGKVNKYLELINTVRQDIERDVLLNTLDKTSKAEQIALLGSTHTSLLRLVQLHDMGPNLYDYMKKKTAKHIRKILEKWEAQPPKLSV